MKQREIKFRGLKKDGTFAYGNLLSIGAIGKWGNSEYYSYSEVDPETVGQFIGRCSKDGVEVYEGDIFQCTGSKGKLALVIWSDSYLSFCGKMLNSEYVFTLYDRKKLNILGNIHQNPELI